ncbi:MAG: M15 family metallopeptidase [bacterium]|nr:M15 family metallopeptidase [bacterium]
MAKTKLKLKKKFKKRLIIFVFILIASIIGIKSYKTYKYHQTYEYKLLEKNYTKEETDLLLEKLDKTKIEELLTTEKNEKLINILKQKYFLIKNLDKYLEYYEKNSDLDLQEVVALVNVHRNKDYYDDMEETDTSLGNTMLVNKYNALSKDYEVENLTNISKTYSYGDNKKLNKEAYDAFIDLAEDAKKEGYTILIVSSYRSYKDQEDVWKDYKASFGTRKADAYAARAGSSEHETGLAIDVADYYDENDKFEDTDSFKWMQANAHKYGYILRYPKGKENITGYSYEAWHYRYVGIETATKVYNEGITYDEYYEYYLKK